MSLLSPVHPNASPASARRRLGLALASLLLVAACNPEPGESPDDEVQRRLVGSWLREYQQEGSRVRRMLVLDADGHFTETARIVDATGGVSEHIHVGQWLFDGVNLKRKYTSVDARPPSRLTLPYATFALRFESNREFVGVDNLRKREVRYLRVEDGTAL